MKRIISIDVVCRNFAGSLICISTRRRIYLFKEANQWLT